MIHRILATINTVHDALTQSAHANPVFLTIEEKRDALISLQRATSRLLELQLRIEAAAQDLADFECARNAAVVLSANNLLDPKKAHTLHQLAQACGRYEHVRAGLATGDFTEDHAHAIITALDALPDDIPAAVVARAEVDLCELATKHQPRELRILGTTILTSVAPEIAEAAIARALAREEADVARKTTLSITPQGDGTTQLRGLVPDAVGTRLQTVLEAYAQPRKTALAADGKTRPRARLLAEALGTLLERLDPKTLPDHGGDATTVIVTMTLESLRTELGLAAMADGTLITASEARRLACTANIIPAVLGGKSEVLDLGRSRRLYTGPQRKALAIRDRHCRAEGCTIPATWCEAHHLNPWSRGGRTDIDTGTLLCSHHHHRIHDPKYETTRLPSGDYRFHLRR